MQRALIVTVALSAGAALLWSAAAEAAQTHNSSRSNRIEGISGGSVDIVSTGGTGVLFESFDENGDLTPVTTTHEITPPGPFDLADNVFDLPAVVDLLGPVGGLWGIDPASNEIGQTGAAGATTMLSRQSQVCPPLCGEAEVDTSTTFTFDSIQTVAKKKAEREREEKGKAIAADRSRTFFDAHTDAQVYLSYVLEELILDAELDTEALLNAVHLGFGVQWSFGEGSTVGASMLFSDSVFFGLSVDPGNPIASLMLTDELIYDLVLDLDAGQQYWFQVDSFSYIVAVPEPSTLGLMLIPAVALLFRRRKP